MTQNRHVPCQYYTRIGSRVPEKRQIHHQVDLCEYFIEQKRPGDLRKKDSSFSLYRILEQ